MIPISKTPPGDNGAFRHALYQGTIFHLAPTCASQRLVAESLALLDEELGGQGSMREAQFRLTNDDFFACIGRLRKRLYEEPRFYRTVCEVMAAFGFESAQHAIDPLRLRVVAHRGDENPRAAPIYYTHRDTWYAHPQAQISAWIPLHDVTEAETFVFFPAYLRQAVENNSGDFDYDNWIRDRRSLRIGWQDPNAGTTALYPAFRGELSPAQRLPFSARAGEIILFAGAHLHQTVKNRTGMTRFSVDFRTVHLEDHRRGIGAPNVDNRSTGSALQDYHLPAGADPAGVARPEAREAS